MPEESGIDSVWLDLDDGGHPRIPSDGDGCEMKPIVWSIASGTSFSTGCHMFSEVQRNPKDYWPRVGFIGPRQDVQIGVDDILL